MDSATLVTIIWSGIGALAVALLGMLVWGLKILITTMFDNTVQIKLLSEKISELVKYYSKTEKLEKDMTVAHQRIRDLQRGSQ